MAVITYANRLTRLSAVVMTLVAVLTLWGCPDAVEDPDPPAAPVVVSKTLPESWTEQGIDADNTGTNRIVIMWHPNTENDLSGYEIYRADIDPDSGFKKIVSIDLFHVFGADTVYYDDSVKTYVDYFYYLRALDNSENLSSPSDTVMYRLLNAPLSLSPNDTTVDRNFVFKWIDKMGNHEYSSEYVIRLDNLDMNETVWIARFTNRWYGYENTTPIPFDFVSGTQSGPSNLLYSAELITPLPSGVYRWKVKAIKEVNNTTNIDESSGESEWTYFTLD